MAKVSIIVPVYNAEKTLARCLESLVHQSYKNIEVILVDDGSTDRSKEICAEYAERYGFIRLIEQSNAGPATARNNGINNASGEYISFVDADDYVDRDFINAMVHVSEAHNADMTVCSYYEESIKGRRIHKYKYKEGLYEGAALKEMAVSLISDVADDRIPPYSWVRMIRRDIFNSPRIRYQDGMVRSEDYFLFTQLAFRIRSMYLMSDRPLYHYLENESSVTHSFVKNYWESVVKMYEELKHRLPAEERVEKGLNIMLLQRSLIALNNASRAADKRDFIKETDKILKDRKLNGAVKSVTLKEGFGEFGPYHTMMRLGLKKLVYLRYSAKRK